MIIHKKGKGADAPCGEHIMRKKLFLSFVILSCALACALTLSACSDVDIDIDGSGIYTYDASAGYVKAEAAKLIPSARPRS